MTEFRAPQERHRDEVARLLALSLNLPPAWVEYRAPGLPLADMRCAFDGDRMVAVAGGRDLRQWWGGREVEMCGIWSVATLPEARGSGLASGAVGQLLREAREAGQPISALYPATLRPYRGLGYELAGSYVQHELALDDIPRGPSGPLAVTEYDPMEDLPDVRACYREAMRHHNGPVDSDDERWWPQRVMGAHSPDDSHRAVVTRGPRGVEGYAAFVHRDTEGDLDVAFLLECTHLVASTLEGLASLLGYFRGFRGLGTLVRFTGPPAEPLAMLVEEQRVRPHWTFRWMLRLLDVPAALEARGYPPVDGSATIAVEDGMFAENRGPWRIEATGGSIHVEPDPGSEVRPIPIGVLSSMFTGYLSPFDAARLGLVDAADPAVPFLARLFAGPAPFMLDFF